MCDYWGVEALWQPWNALIGDDFTDKGGWTAGFARYIDVTGLFAE